MLKTWLAIGILSGLTCLCANAQTLSTYTTSAPTPEYPHYDSISPFDIDREDQLYMSRYIGQKIMFAKLSSKAKLDKRWSPPYLILAKNQSQVNLNPPPFETMEVYKFGRLRAQAYGTANMKNPPEDSYLKEKRERYAELSKFPTSVYCPMLDSPLTSDDFDKLMQVPALSGQLRRRFVNDPKCIEGKTFRIDSIVNAKNRAPLKADQYISMDEFVMVLSEVTSGERLDMEFRPYLLFKDKGSYASDLGSPIVPVALINRYNRFKDSSLIYVGREQLLNLKTNLSEDLTRGTRLKCEGVSFVERYEGSTYPTIMLILADSAGRKYAHGLNAHVSTSNSFNPDRHVLAPELEVRAYYAKKEKAEKAVALAEARREKQERLVAQRQQVQYRASILKKYGTENGKLILAGKVKLGWSEAMCLAAWGDPYDTTTVTNKFGTVKRLTYYNGDDIGFLDFANGKLVQIVN